LFYIAFEFVFFLLFFYISGWGYRVGRLRASFYMVFFTVVVSLPFLVFLVYESGTRLRFFFFRSCSDLWVFCFFVFFVKLPVYGVHIWLPKAHVESPLGGSMILAGVLLKLGGYGVIRFSFCLLDLVFG
jgi:NADH-ubiquinone oxidoreductase chain 4